CAALAQQGVMVEAARLSPWLLTLVYRGLVGRERDLPRRQNVYRYYAINGTTPTTQQTPTVRDTPAAVVHGTPARADGDKTADMVAFLMDLRPRIPHLSPMVLMEILKQSGRTNDPPPLLTRLRGLAGIGDYVGLEHAIDEFV